MLADVPGAVRLRVAAGRELSMVERKRVLKHGGHYEAGQARIGEADSPHGHATADLIESGWWLSRCMTTVAAVVLVAGGLLGYALAPRQSAPSSENLALAIEQSLDSAIVKYCTSPASQ
jgi:hypothetical protein